MNTHILPVLYIFISLHLLQGPPLARLTACWVTLWLGWGHPGHCGMLSSILGPQSVLRTLLVMTTTDVPDITECPLGAESLLLRTTYRSLPFTLDACSGLRRVSSGPSQSVCRPLT